MFDHLIERELPKLGIPFRIQPGVISRVLVAASVREPNIKTEMRQNKGETVADGKLAAVEVPDDGEVVAGLNVVAVGVSASRRVDEPVCS